MAPRTRCGSCGVAIESFEAINVVGVGERCYSCFNREADRLGVRFDDTPLQPIVVADPEGVSHTFEIRSRLVATGHAMEALERTNNGQSGYRFEVLGDHEIDAWALFQSLYAKMRREIATRHVERKELGWQITSAQRLVGRIEWDPNTDGGVPLLVVDGKAFTWDQVGRMLITFEGFTLDAHMEDSIEIVDDAE